MLSPQLNYNANYVKANDTAANPTRGGEAASMLLGIPSGSMGISDSYVEQDKYFALYIADDWKVSKKLTLNLGLRYEYESPMTERFDRAAIHFAGTTPNPLNDAAAHPRTRPCLCLPSGRSLPTTSPQRRTY
jgi:outer membrane receptor protein involved in Fe transport